MEFKWWILIILTVLVVVNFYTGGFVNAKLEQAMTAAGPTIADKGVCAFALYMTVPFWYIPQAEDLVIALAVTLGLCYVLKNHITNLKQKIMLFGVVWLAFKLICLWLVTRDAGCNSLYQSYVESNLLSGALGVIISLIFMFFGVRWILSKR